jgi:hypothetical protein
MEKSASDIVNIWHSSSISIHLFFRRRWGQAGKGNTWLKLNATAAPNPTTNPVGVIGHPID